MAYATDTMTEELPDDLSFPSDDARIDMERVARQLPERGENMELRVTHREIGNGPQYAIELWDGHSIVYESRWYTGDAFEAFVDGMSQFSRIEREIEEHRDD